MYMYMYIRHASTIHVHVHYVETHVHVAITPTINMGTHSFSIKTVPEEIHVGSKPPYSIPSSGHNTPYCLVATIHHTD